MFTDRHKPVPVKRQHSCWRTMQRLLTGPPRDGRRAVRSAGAHPGNRHGNWRSRFMPMRWASVARPTSPSCWHMAGIDYDKQRAAIEAGVDVLIGTPGRIIDYFKQKVFGLGAIEVLVLDEADRMFDLGFIKDIRYVLRAHATACRASEHAVFSDHDPARQRACLRAHEQSGNDIDRSGQANSGQGYAAALPCRKRRENCTINRSFSGRLKPTQNAGFREYKTACSRGRRMAAR